MSTPEAIKFEREIPQVLSQFGAAHGAVQAAADASGLPRAIYHLIQLRASQINGCAFCVKMHTREARQDGESDDRLDRLVVWRHVADFSPAERAALAWTEALTRVEDDTDYGALRAALRAHYDEGQLAAIASLAAMINLWNRLQVSKH
ncbi:carboxymuconolactone decarboxylase family protein [Lysobacter enzymogenes]|uniref:carboxymuconolactone decarboxylase family protein n=1 Tax=Lysobacter enzymogenes TaxID=69 RepID=UPI001AF6FB3C|nr:carboxymuconolactone decarboxylase family protein [Lysobacter enzymogenes]QQQ01468.1 carboxymuconolactone decarboxylase family protein [Lysobacter enzymogenes]